MPLNPYRAEFEIPRDITYLNCAFHSPLVTAAKRAAEVGLDSRSRPWEMSPKGFFTDVEKARTLFAKIINGDPEGVAVIPSVSYGMGIAAKNMSLPPGSRILIPEGEFPSNVYIWREFARSRELELVTVPAPADYDWTKVVLSLLDERVSMVTVPPCHWCDGSRFDLKTIGQRAREVGAKFLVDGSQAIGTLPVNIEEWDPDFLVCVGYKWLLGPYGVSFLYVPKRHREGHPLEFGWLNRKGCEDFSRLCEYTDHFSEGARRFDVGQKTNPILLPMLNASLQSILTWGLANVQKKIGETSQQIVQMLSDAKLELIPENRRMPHIIGVRTPKAREWAMALAEKRVFVSARDKALRISPHIYNDQKDIERLTQAVHEL